MPSYLEQLAQRNYNPDGTMKLEYRERLRSRGICEAQLDQREVRHIRKAKLDQQVQELREEHERHCAEAEQDWKQDAQQRQEERAQLGPVSSLVKTVDLSAMSLQERYRFEVAGLDREDLMSQGFMEPGDFYTQADEPPILGGEETRQYYVLELATDEEF